MPASFARPGSAHYPRAGGAALAQLPRAGKVEAHRLGLRIAQQIGSSGALAPASSIEFATLDLAAGSPDQRIFDIVVGLEVDRHGDQANIRMRLRNAGPGPVQVEGAVIGLRWTEHGQTNLRFLRNGWQSWSYTDTCELDDRGEPAFPSGEWLRGMHHVVGARGEERAGWHESACVTLVGAAGGGASCVVGALETGRAFSLVYLRRSGDRGGRGVAVELELEQRLEVVLEPGEQRELEAVIVLVGTEGEPLLARFAELWAREAGARRSAPFRAGWCSWYHFFHEVDEGDLLRNLEALAAARDAIPVEVVQLDDGYQHEVGDWLETNAKFPRGIAPLASEIRAAGFRAGIWTAPFCVVPRSRLFAAHPDWVLRDGDAPFLGLLHGEWSARDQGRVYALDPSRREVREHLRSLFASLVGMGFDYLKLDFLHAAAMRADAHDASRTRAERLRLGLDAIREGAGADAFLLGCGCPLGPAVGVVDAMRIGPDVAPHWHIDPGAAIPGLEPVVPSLQSALRSVLQRAWMHRRLWLNDPDCLMARAADTQLSRDEVRTLATAIAATGGMTVVSDDLPGLDEESRALVHDAMALARAVDASLAMGSPRSRLGGAPGAADDDDVAQLEIACGRDALRARINLSDRPQVCEPLPGSPLLGTEAGVDVASPLAAHASRLALERDGLDLIVFCDFDGTFSVQDVGSTLARKYLSDRRVELWAGYERGDYDAWHYNEQLFTGFDLSEIELQAFLRGIELDPGARTLVAWCRERDVPFRVLSDGFDRNLDALQRIHGIEFDYVANTFRYADGGSQGGADSGGWRIVPGSRNADCPCGTGTCKRGLIEAHRRALPSAFCVHVGNGRVSDLCGALAADLVFAKESLAEALDERGRAYVPFASLHDVVRGLEDWLSGRLGPRLAAAAAPG